MEKNKQTATGKAWRFVATLTLLLSTALCAQAWEGEGTAASPYLINNTDDFDALATDVNNGETMEGVYFSLQDDLDYSGKMFTPVGIFISLTNLKIFKGIFRGNGKTISGVQIISADSRKGVFAIIGEGGIVQSLKLADSEIEAGSYSGGIAGNNQGTINDCHVARSVTIRIIHEDGYYGGVTGWNQGVVTNCTSAASLEKDEQNIVPYVGGIIGVNDGVYNKGITINCLYYGNKIEGNIGIGAIIGSNMNHGTVSNCYYTLSDVPGCGDGADSGYTFAYVLNTMPTNISSNPESATSTEGGLTVYDNGMGYGGRYYCPNPQFVPLILQNSRDNTGALDDATKSLVTVSGVKLNGRIIYTDGDWNTICLPFNLTLAGSVLDGFTARPLKSASLDNGTLCLNFAEPVDVLQAGTPYIIKKEATKDIKNPSFPGVTSVTTTTHNFTSTDGKVQFIGSYNPVPMTADDQSILFLGAENTLYYPNTDASLRAFRAYFKITDGSEVKQTNFNFEGEEDNATAISTVSGTDRTANGDNTWYTLSGMRLSGTPSAPGIYIRGGKKYMVK